MPGTGVGLASCRLLADAMGGSVGVESKLGEGSRFYLRLPLVVGVEAAPVSDNLNLPPTSVLLVEDTDYNAIAAKAVLAKLGLGCERASNGEEALRMFAEKRHHIVLLDRNLPDMDGTEVARRMREIETDGMHSLLLAVTAYCTSDDRKLCLDSGMDAFVGKPLTPDKLRKVLATAAGDQMLTASPVAAPTAPAPAPAAPQLDVTLLKFLADDAQGGVAVQAARFIEELNSAQDAMLHARSDGTPAIFGDAVHRVLGQARMIGANRLTELCIELETGARKSDDAVVNHVLPQVAMEIAVVTAALRRHPAVLQA